MDALFTRELTHGEKGLHTQKNPSFLSVTDNGRVVSPPVNPNTVAARL